MMTRRALRLFLFSTLLLLGCNPRLEQRTAPYNPEQCPFCIPTSGKCNYCNGTAKCTFCDGTGTRITSTKNIPESQITETDYKESCQYCGGTGKCRHCDGKGICWACEGTQKVDNWNFYEKYRTQQNRTSNK